MHALAACSAKRVFLAFLLADEAQPFDFGPSLVRMDKLKVEARTAKAVGGTDLYVTRITRFQREGDFPAIDSDPHLTCGLVNHEKGSGPGPIFYQRVVDVHGMSHIQQRQRAGAIDIDAPPAWGWARS